MKFGYIFFEMCEIAIRSYLIIMIMFCLFWLQLFSTIVPKDHRELRREEEEERDGRRQTSISVLPTPYLAYQTYLGPMSRLSVGILYPQKERLPRISMATSVSRSAETNTAELYFHCLFFSPDRVWGGQLNKRQCPSLGRPGTINNQTFHKVYDVTRNL